MNIKKHPLLFTILLVFIPISGISQSNFDTLAIKDVSDGVKYYNIVESSKPWDIYVLEIDLTNPHIKIETAKATNKVSGNEWVSNISMNNSYNYHSVVGAINGDFFDGNGVSTGHQVVNGELVSSIQYRNWSKLAFDEYNKPYIERFNTSSTVFISSDTNTLSGVNVTRNENYIVLYNRFAGNSTNTNQWGTEYLLTPISQWAINETLQFVVNEIEYRIGNMELTENKVVLSAHGNGETFLSGLQVGDTVALNVGMQPMQSHKLMQLISGFPKIVMDGQNYALAGYSEEGGAASFATDKHPRTSAGFNADSTKLFLFVVDGRQSSSIGVSLIELADIMLMFGVHTGLNLDGGGSSTMVVHHEVVNSPSGGLQRAVSNALLVVSSEQTTIEELHLIPDTVVTNLSTPIQFSFTSFDSYGYGHNFEFDDATIIIGDPSIGYFEDGWFYPTSKGSTTIDLILHNGQDQSIINVEEFTGTELINGFELEDEWFMTSDKIDSNNSGISFNRLSFTEGNQSLQLDYNFTYEAGQFYWAYLNTNIHINGVPESFELDVLGDGRNHTVAFVISDENDEKFALLLNKSPSANEFESLSAKFDSPIDIEQVGAQFYFPIKLKQIAISLSSGRQIGETYTGQILFDNLRVNYPENVTSIKQSDDLFELDLSQNYPNPFNPITTIQFALPHNSLVEITIYNSLGEKIETLAKRRFSKGIHKVEFNAEQYSSGVYFYRLIAGDQRIVKRMILLK